MSERLSITPVQNKLIQLIGVKLVDLVRSEVIDILLNNYRLAQGYSGINMILTTHLMSIRRIYTYTCILVSRYVDFDICRKSLKALNSLKLVLIEPRK